MSKTIEYEFCMHQFKPMIAILALFLVLVLAWSGYHCTQGTKLHGFQPVAAQKPMAPNIKVKNKMLHPYWGNCNKCHITVNAGNPISQVMAGPPISIKDKMLHEYWGNCLLCHTVADGFKPTKKMKVKIKIKTKVKAAAFTNNGNAICGMTLTTVTAASMKQFGLANKDGVMLLSVAPGSPAQKAGLKKGDEITVVGKKRIEDVRDFQTEISHVQPGKKVKLKVFRGNRMRNVYLKVVPQGTGQARVAAATQPWQSNAQAGIHQQHMGVNANQQQQYHQTTGVSGKVAIAASGPGYHYAVSPVFGTSPYFILFDPATKTGRAIANPNATDLADQGAQTGHYMVDSGVNNVIAGSYSPDALETLHMLRVTAYSGLTGRVSDVLTAYSQGHLTPVQ